MFGNYQRVFSFPSTLTIVISRTSTAVKLHGVKAAAGGVCWKLRFKQCFRLTFMITTDLRYAGGKRFQPIGSLGDWQEKKKCYRSADICQPWILWNHLSPRFSVPEHPENALVVQKNANITTHTATPKEVSELLCNDSGAMECAERIKWWKNYQNRTEGALLLYVAIYWRPQGSKLLSKLV